MREEGFDAAEIASITDEEELAVEINVEVNEMLKVFRGSVICVDDVGGDVAGGRGCVVWGEDAGIVLAGIAGDVLGARAVEGEAVGGENLPVNILREGENDFVGDDLGFKPGIAEFAGDIFRSLVVLF